VLRALVVHAKQITRIDGFVDAVEATFTVYGAARNLRLAITVRGFDFTPMTSGDRRR